MNEKDYLKSLDEAKVILPISIYDRLIEESSALSLIKDIVSKVNAGYGLSKDLTEDIKTILGV